MLDGPRKYKSRDARVCARGRQPHLFEWGTVKFFDLFMSANPRWRWQLIVLNYIRTGGPVIWPNNCVSPGDWLLPGER